MQNYFSIILSVQHKYFIIVYILAQCIHRHGYLGAVQIECSALFCRALPCNFGESSAVNLVPSSMGIVIEAFGVFGHLGKCL